MHQSLVYSLVGMSLRVPQFSPEDPPVKVAVIGTGGRGTDLIRKLSTIEATEIVAICDNYPPHLKKASKFAGPQAKLFEDLRELLKEIKPFV